MIEEKPKKVASVQKCCSKARGLAPIEELAHQRVKVCVSSPSGEILAMEKKRNDLDILKKLERLYPPTQKRNMEVKLPEIKCMKPTNPILLRKNIGSVESLRRAEVNKRIVDLYKASPLKTPLNLKVLENKENGLGLINPYKKPPCLPLKYERPMLLHRMVPACINPVRQAGLAVVDRRIYHVNPQWWG